VQHYCEGPTVSETALRAAGVVFTDLVLRPKKGLVLPDKGSDDDPLPVVVSWRADSRTHVKRKDGVYLLEWGENESFTPPAQGMFVETRRPTKDNWQHGYWHILGTAIIEYEGRCFLCGLDEGTYFVCELPAKPRNCDHAYEMLKPKPVRDAEADGLEVLRQGEWFFVPTNMNDAALAETLGWSRTKLGKMAKVDALPKRANAAGDQGSTLSSSSSNLHVCRQLVLQSGKRIYVTGKVFHREPLSTWAMRDNPKKKWGDLTRQHQTLNLGKDWYIAYPNTEVQSWSMSGQFD
jgi:hypothetical protein